MKRKPKAILEDTTPVVEEVVAEDTAVVEEPAAVESVEVAAPVEVAEAAELVETAEVEETPARPLTRRYNKRGKRRGKYAYAAPLGLLISLLSILGALSLVSATVGLIKDATDTTYLHEELYYFLEPLVKYSPESFHDAAKNPKDVFLDAAIWRLVDAELDRMNREKDEMVYAYEEESGRIVIPAGEVESAYKALFGPTAKLKHRTLENSGVEYDESDNSYYVPYQLAASLEKAFVVSVDRSSDEYVVRMGYVIESDIPYDRYGNQVEPTEEMATHFKVFTLKRLDDDKYYIYSCKDE